MNSCKILQTLAYFCMPMYTFSELRTLPHTFSAFCIVSQLLAYNLTHSQLLTNSLKLAYLGYFCVLWSIFAYVHVHLQVLSHNFSFSCIWDAVLAISKTVLGWLLLSWNRFTYYRSYLSMSRLGFSNFIAV